tara:strand:+ start:13376 stop:14197 length:822 start_codon:yes stop_codon:yes gene_type:complete
MIFKAQIYKLLVLVLFSFGFLSCSVSKNKKVDSKYTLVFEDQFNGNSYNTKHWSSYPENTGTSPWNRFVVDDKQLTEVKNGNLHVKVRWNSATDLPETGAIFTKGKFSFKYGKIEVKAKFNKAGQGGWPAIWLMPQTEIYKGWPDGGEIDIMERLNNDEFVHQVVHQTNGKKTAVSSGKTPAINFDGYNLYGIVKLPNRIEFYVNNVLTMVHEPKEEFQERWPFETDYYIILNHASADKGKTGTYFWPGNVTNTDDFPLEMAVDYVKVWEIKE